MTHREFLLEAILDDPADDLPRLAYADACEEDGDLVHAEFIRLSLRYAQYLDAKVSDREIIQIARRMDEIYVRACELILVDLRFDYAYTWSPVESFHDHGREQHQTIYLWRGFVREVALTQDLFLQHAEALFNSHPIERVRLIDRVPAEWVPASERSVPAFSWHCDHQLVDTPSLLLMPIWSCLDYLESEERGGVFKLYPSREEANQALEVAALAWGKSLRKSTGRRT